MIGLDRAAIRARAEHTLRTCHGANRTQLARDVLDLLNVLDEKKPPRACACANADCEDGLVQVDHCAACDAPIHHTCGDCGGRPAPCRCGGFWQAGAFVHAERCKDRR